MAQIERVLQAQAADVFAVLADGWTYSDWVVGTAHIRDVDATWPAVGAQLHHKVGPWPLSLKDTSVVLECDPGRMLLTKVRIWPLGEGHVRLTIVPLDNGTSRVTMWEDFTGGPLRWLRNKLQDAVLHLRNGEALRRLEDLARNRVAATDSGQ
jgi:hypothetical protein